MTVGWQIVKRSRCYEQGMPATHVRHLDTTANLGTQSLRRYAIWQESIVAASVYCLPLDQGGTIPFIRA